MHTLCSRLLVLAVATLPIAIILAAAIAIGTPAAAQSPPASSPPSPSQSAQPETQAQSPPESSKPALPADLSSSILRLRGAIENAEKTIQQLAELEDDLGSLRVEVETILAGSQETAESLRPELAAVRSQIEKLGDPPGKDQPPEAPALAAERARLTALDADLDGAIKSAEVTWVRARQLIEKITVMRYSLFTKNLLERRPSPLLPGIWRDLASRFPAISQRLSYLAEDWLGWASIKRLQLGLLCSCSSSGSRSSRFDKRTAACCAWSRRPPSSSAQGQWHG
jgi:potassium-dependent mechanosensitive channel